MKKIIIILIMVIGLSITSCKYSGNYDFIGKEDVVNALKVYTAKVTLVNTDKSESSFTLTENGEYFYYSYNTRNYFIEKNTKEGRTFTEVIPLDKEGRKREIARIIGGAVITEKTLASAEEMLK